MRSTVLSSDWHKGHNGFADWRVMNLCVFVGTQKKKSLMWVALCYYVKEQ